MVDEQHGAPDGDALTDGGVELGARRLVEACPGLIEHEQTGGGDEPPGRHVSGDAADHPGLAQTVPLSDRLKSHTPSVARGRRREAGWRLLTSPSAMSRNGATPAANT